MSNTLSWDATALSIENPRPPEKNSIFLRRGCASAARVNAVSTAVMLLDANMTRSNPVCWISSADSSPT